MGASFNKGKVISMASQCRSGVHITITIMLPLCALSLRHIQGDVEHEILN